MLVALHADRQLQRRSRSICIAGAALAALAAAGPASAQAVSQSPRSTLDSLLAIPVHAAARYAQSTSDAAAAVTVITAEEIAAFGYRTLDQVLARAAGFYVSYDRNYNYVGVRGFSRPTDYNNRLLLLLNGQVLNEHTYGSAPVGDDLGIDLALLERVEIVRGPVSALYGTSAMLAVINLVTVEPDATGAAIAGDVGSGGLYVASARAHYAANHRRLLIAAQAGREYGEDLYYSEFDSATADGMARGLDWARYASVFGAARLGEFRLQGRVTERDKGIPTAAWESEFGNDGTQTRDGYAQLAAEFKRVVAPGLDLALSAAADLYWYRGWYPGEGFAFRDATDGRRFGAGAQLVWDATARQRLVTGLAVQHSPRGDFREWTDDYLETDYDRVFSTAAFYVQDELFLGPWASVVLGGRIDVESDSRSHVTPRVSVLLRPHTGTTLKLLYGEAFRSPNLYERTYNAEVRTTVITPERIRTSELVAEHRLSSNATLRVSLFNDEINDLIDPSVEPNSGEYTLINAGTARTRGVEGDFTLSVQSWLIHGAGTWLTAIDRSTGERLTNAPARVIRLGVNGMVAPPLSLAAQVRAESGRLTMRGNETRAFGLLDGAMTYRLGAHASAHVHVSNAFNRSYAYPGGLEHVQDEISQDGRRVRLRMEIKR